MPREGAYVRPQQLSQVPEQGWPLERLPSPGLPPRDLAQPSPSQMAQEAQQL